MSKGRGRPRAEIGKYTGPYRRVEIENARRSLIDIVDSKDTYLWSTIKLKTGIYENGERNFSPRNSFGDPSCRFSHADLNTGGAPQGSGPSRSQMIDLTASPGGDLDKSLEVPDTDCIIIEEGEKATTPGKRAPDNGSLGKGLDSGVSDVHGDSMDDARAMAGTKVIVKDECRVLVKEEDIENDSMSDNYEEMVDDDSCMDSFHEENRNRENIDPVNVYNVKKEVMSPIQDRENSSSVKFHTIKKEPTTPIQGTSNTGSVFNVKTEPISPAQEQKYSGSMQALDIKKNATSPVHDRKNSDFSQVHRVKKESTSPAQDRKTSSFDQVLDVKNEAISQIKDRKLIKNDASFDDMSLSATDTGYEASATSSHESKPEVYGQRIVLKCDFCNEIANNPGLMMGHLKTSVHYSASSFYCNGNINDLILQNRLVLINKSALYKSVLAVCPAKKCDLVFKTIHECCHHYREKHDGSDQPTYALCNVREVVHCDMNKDDMQCPECKLVADNKTQLKKHMRLANHFPYEEKEGLKCYFYCRICHEFSPTFSSAYSHQSDEHKKKMKDGVLRLSLLYGAEKVIHYLQHDPQLYGTNTKRKAEDDKEAVLKKHKVESGDLVDNLRQDLKEGYRCDYCDMASDFEDGVMSHMRAAGHTSASLVLMDPALKPVYLKRPMALELKLDKREVMAVCPAPHCDQAFMKPHFCCDHYTSCHGEGNDPTYAVSDVEEREKLKYTRDAGSRSYTLPSDVKARVTKKMENAIKCFVCAICDWTFCSHNKMSIHLRQKHSGQGSKKTVAVTLLLLSRNKVRQPVLTYQNNPKGEQQAIKRKIQTLVQLRKKSTKQSKKDLSKKIRELNKLKKK